MSNVITLRKRRPERENARVVGTDSGASEGFELQQPRQSTETPNRLQVLAERMDAFKRLERAYQQAGWQIYPLSDDSLLATYARWGLSQVLPDARAAAVFLRKIGGAA